MGCAACSDRMPGMKIALFGAAGFVGRAAALALAGRRDVDELILVDYEIRAAKGMARALSAKCRWAMADVGRAPDLERLLGSLDAAASAVGPCAQYETAILRACARMGVPAASIGDRTLNEADRRELDDAFRLADVPAASGCGMMPGFTELLAAHFLSGPGLSSQPSVGEREQRRDDGVPLPERASTAGERSVAKEGRPPGLTRFLFFTPARFGGYAFYRTMAGPLHRPAGPVPAAPRGDYFETEDGDLVGLPPGRPAAAYAAVWTALSPLGSAGRELAAALRFWLKGRIKAAPSAPAAAAGIMARGDKDTRSLRVEDPGGRLAGLLLAETALALARRRGTASGLLPLPELISREDAERIVSEGGGKIFTE